MSADLKYFSQKNIVILSIVKWGKMRVSKHHYALELAASGNKVLYIEPPDIHLKQKFHIRESEEVKGLYIISYKPIARGKRFLPIFIYKQLEYLQAKTLLKYLKITLDILISFDPNRFSDLRWFNAKVSIFFATDIFSSSEVPGEVKTADLCLGVSHSIVQRLQLYNKRSYFINHGLNSAFVKMAKEKLEINNAATLPIRLVVGYIGNLLIGSLDRQAMTKVIQAHPEISFIFWGQYLINQDNAVMTDASDLEKFINFLSNASNVELAGPKSQVELSIDMKRANLFWLCYNNQYTWAVDGSNSHKILEYLATGQPIISSMISLYQDTDLIYMFKENDNAGFPDFFSNIVQQIPAIESNFKRKQRIEFALTNSYINRLAQIEKLINELNNFAE